ncbi:MAG: dihydropteroate synthase, partial [Proteobacteria bacterium]|nr:dihydropteroate synthase [Pseudomonadota bacterium]
SQLAQQYASALPAKVAEFEIRGHTFRSTEKPHLMGVVNLSSDSWYRESVVTNTDAAITRARRLRTEGAHLVDLGTESSLGHAARVDPSQQIATLLPIVQPLAQEGSLISIETYHPEVARRCLEAGAASGGARGGYRSRNLRERPTVALSRFAVGMIATTWAGMSHSG